MDNKEQAKQVLTKLISEAFLQNFREQRDKEAKKDRERKEIQKEQGRRERQLEIEDQMALQERLDKEEYSQRLADERRNSGLPVNNWVSDEIVEYTYKPGDTFGQVIKDLGLNTDAGLWGSNGDVNYYTQQLVEQGALNSRGNVPIGTVIKLKRRPMSERPTN